MREGALVGTREHREIKFTHISDIDLGFAGLNGLTYRCDACAALVINIKTHGDFHAKLALDLAELNDRIDYVRESVGLDNGV